MSPATLSNSLVGSLSLQIPFKILSGHDHVVSSCHFCVDDTKLLSGSYDSTVKLWVGGPCRAIVELKPGSAEHSSPGPCS